MSYNDKFRIIEVNLDKMDSQGVSSLRATPELKFLTSFGIIGDDFTALERYCKQHKIPYMQETVKILNELFRDIRGDRTIIEAINLYKQIGEDIKEAELPMEVQKTLKEQGIQQGIQQGKIAMLLELGFSDEEISDKLKLPIDKVRELKTTISTYA